MSNDEQLLAQGRILHDYTETKKRLVALKAAGRSMATILHAGAHAVDDQSHTTTRLHAEGNRVTVTYPTAGHLNADGDWPTLIEVTALQGEIAATKQRLNGLVGQLKQLGIPVDERA